MSVPRKTLSLIMAPLWRHQWLLLVCLTVTVGYSLLSIFDVYLEGNIASEYRVLHGWPRVYVERLVEIGDWNNHWWNEFWRIGARPQFFDLSALALDLAVVVAFCLCSVYAWAWRCAHAKKTWQFSVKEFLLVTAVIGLVGGFYAKQRMDYLAGQTLLIELRKAGLFTHHTPSMLWYVRPLRDLRLIGDDAWTESGVFLQSSNKLGFDLDNLNHFLSEKAASHQTSPSIDYVSLSVENLNDEGVRGICQIAPDCHRFRLGSNADISDAGLRSLLREVPHITLLHISSRSLTDESFEILSQFQQLEELEIDDTSGLSSAKNIEPLKRLPRLRRLTVPKHWLLSPAEKEFDHPVDLHDSSS